MSHLDLHHAVRFFIIGIALIYVSRPDAPALARSLSNVHDPPLADMRWKGAILTYVAIWLVSRQGVRK